MLSELERDPKAKCPHVFLNRNGEPYKLISTVFDDAVSRADIEDFHFHDLRHTFASRLVMAGVDLRSVQILMGHKTISMTLRYSHLAPEHLRKAVQSLDFRKKSHQFSQHPSVAAANQNR
jgi:site-specific recombinase XerD